LGAELAGHVLGAGRAVAELFQHAQSHQREQHARRKEALRRREYLEDVVLGQRIVHGRALISTRAARSGITLAAVAVRGQARHDQNR
jgi:hypothetical protein